MDRASVRDLVDRALEGLPPDREEALAVLRVSDSQTLSLVAEVARVRRHFFQDRVKLNFLLNIKSGLCPEDCQYCSQSKLSTAPIPRYSMLPPAAAVQAATIAVGTGAKRFCMVASGRGPSQSELRRFLAAVRAVKGAHPDLEICACLGLLADGQAEQLKEAGVYAYNHNLNTSQDHYGKICSTHDFADRRQTVSRAKASGLSPCSGALFGMGEADEDIVDVGFALRELEPDSVPINFLIPIEGTPLAGDCELTPLRCLRILALYRLLFPDVEVRIAGGREVHLRSLQPLGLQLANSIFAGDYLTTKGQAASADLDLIADCGLRVETADELTLPRSRLAPVVLKTSAFD
ncbi:biotin synthase BioB [bacterium]|nr:MAG: biotin synthase BioB [bacterium]